MPIKFILGKTILSEVTKIIRKEMEHHVPRNYPILIRIVIDIDVKHDLLMTRKEILHIQLNVPVPIFCEVLTKGTKTTPKPY